MNLCVLIKQEASRVSLNILQQCILRYILCRVVLLKILQPERFKVTRSLRMQNLRMAPYFVTRFQGFVAGWIGATVTMTGENGSSLFFAENSKQYVNMVVVSKISTTASRRFASVKGWRITRFSCNMFFWNLTSIQSSSIIPKCND